MFHCLGAGMVLNEEKRNRLAELIARRQAATGAGGLAPTGPPCLVVSAQDSSGPTPGAKQKGVVVIDSEDEDTDEGLGWVSRRPHSLPLMATPLSSGTIPQRLLSSRTPRT